MGCTIFYEHTIGICNGKYRSTTMIFHIQGTDNQRIAAGTAGTGHIPGISSHTIFDNLIVIKVFVSVNRAAISIFDYRTHYRL